MTHFKTVTPDCLSCGDAYADVVFFGGTVPKPRAEQRFDSHRSIGGSACRYSSLQVYSGFRFCRYAQKRRIPIVIVNEGQTRADDIATSRLVAWHAATGICHR